MRYDEAIPETAGHTTDVEPGTIYLVREDHERLLPLVEGNDAGDPALREAIARLEEEIDRAVVVEAADVPPDTITLDSWVRLLDLDSEQELLVSPVVPSRSNADVGRISVLAPLGTAVLGYRTGDTIEWRVPGGLRRLRVLSVMYQPEAHARRAKAAEAARERSARRAAKRVR